MMSFHDFLGEARYHEIVHINPHPDTVKNIAKQAGSARFIIHSNGEAHVGSSYYHTHDSLENGAPTYHSAGMVRHVHGNEFQMYAEAPNHNEPVKHPFLDKLEKSGIEMRLTSSQERS